nr:MAG TPA: hypothetical protein [Inoviridae sp.]
MTVPVLQLSKLGLDWAHDRDGFVVHLTTDRDTGKSAPFHVDLLSSQYVAGCFIPDVVDVVEIQVWVPLGVGFLRCVCTIGPGLKFDHDPDLSWLPEEALV